MQRSKNPKQGEIWLVDLNPILGHEKFGVRPCVVISNHLLMNEQVKYIVPISTKNYNSRIVVFIPKDEINNLDNDSYAHCLHLRSVDHLRFSRKIGEISNETLDDITTVIGYLICK